MLLLLKNYIKGYRNALSEELCKYILNEYSNTNEWKDSTIYLNNHVDKSYRNCKSINISNKENVSKNYEIRMDIEQKIYDILWTYVDKYKKSIKNNVQFYGDSGFEIVKYDSGGYYREHMDSGGMIQRALSCSIHLNDDYEGGEWGFFGNTATFRMPKGSILFFPSNFMYPHQIKTVTKGIRYSLITWII